MVLGQRVTFASGQIRKTKLDVAPYDRAASAADGMYGAADETPNAHRQSMWQQADESQHAHTQPGWPVAWCPKTAKRLAITAHDGGSL